MPGDTSNPEDLSYLGSHVQQLVSNQELRASVQQPKVLPGARKHKLDALARGKRVQVSKQVLRRLHGASHELDEAQRQWLAHEQWGAAADSILRIAPGAVALPDPSQQLQQQASGTAAPPRTRWGFFPLLKHLTTRNPDEVPAAALGAPPSPFAAADEQLGPAPWDGEESDIERLDSWGSLPGGGRQQAAYGRGDWSALVQCRRQQQREALAHVVRLRHAAIVIQRCWRRFVANRTSNQLAMLILRQKVRRAAAARSAARKAVRKVAAAAISSAGTITLGSNAEFDSGDHVEYLVDWWPEARRLEEMSYEELQGLLQQLEQQAEERRQKEAAGSEEQGEEAPDDEVTEAAAPQQQAVPGPKVGRGALRVQLMDSEFHGGGWQGSLRTPGAKSRGTTPGKHLRALDTPGGRRLAAAAAAGGGSGLGTPSRKQGAAGAGGVQAGGDGSQQSHQQQQRQRQQEQGQAPWDALPSPADSTGVPHKRGPSRLLGGEDGSGPSSPLAAAAATAAGAGGGAGSHSPRARGPATATAAAAAAAAAAGAGAAGADGQQVQPRNTDNMSVMWMALANLGNSSTATSSGPQGAHKQGSTNTVAMSADAGRGSLSAAQEAAGGSSSSSSNTWGSLQSDLLHLLQQLQLQVQELQQQGQVDIVAQLLGEEELQLLKKLQASRPAAGGVQMSIAASTAVAGAQGSSSSSTQPNSTAGGADPLPGAAAAAGSTAGGQVAATGAAGTAAKAAPGSCWTSVEEAVLTRLLEQQRSGPPLSAGQQCLLEKLLQLQAVSRGLLTVSHTGVGMPAGFALPGSTGGVAPWTEDKEQLLLQLLQRQQQEQQTGPLSEQEQHLLEQLQQQKAAAGGDIWRLQSAAALAGHGWTPSQQSVLDKLLARQLQQGNGLSPHQQLLLRQLQAQRSSAEAAVAAAAEGAGAGGKDTQSTDMSSTSATSQNHVTLWGPTQEVTLGLLVLLQQQAGGLSPEEQQLLTQLQAQQAAARNAAAEAASAASRAASPLDGTRKRISRTPSPGHQRGVPEVTSNWAERLAAAAARRASQDRERASTPPAFSSSRGGGSTGCFSRYERGLAEGLQQGYAPVQPSTISSKPPGTAGRSPRASDTGTAPGSRATSPPHQARRPGSPPARVPYNPSSRCSTPGTMGGTSHAQAASSSATGPSVTAAAGGEAKGSSRPPTGCESMASGDTTALPPSAAAAAVAAAAGAHSARPVSGPCAGGAVAAAGTPVSRPTTSNGMPAPAEDPLSTAAAGAAARPSSSSATSASAAGPNGSSSSSSSNGRGVEPVSSGASDTPTDVAPAHLPSADHDLPPAVAAAAVAVAVVPVADVGPAGTAMAAAPPVLVQAVRAAVSAGGSGDGGAAEWLQHGAPTHRHPQAPVVSPGAPPTGAVTGSDGRRPRQAARSAAAASPAKQPQIVEEEEEQQQQQQQQQQEEEEEEEHTKECGTSGVSASLGHVSEVADQGLLAASDPGTPTDTWWHRQTPAPSTTADNCLLRPAPKEAAVSVPVASAAALPDAAVAAATAAAAGAETEAVAVASDSVSFPRLQQQELLSQQAQWAGGASVPPPASGPASELAAAVAGSCTLPSASASRRSTAEHKVTWDGVPRVADALPGPAAAPDRAQGSVLQPSSSGGSSSSSSSSSSRDLGSSPQQADTAVPAGAAGHVQQQEGSVGCADQSYSHGLLGTDLSVGYLAHAGPCGHYTEPGVHPSTGTADPARSGCAVTYGHPGEAPGVTLGLPVQGYAPLGPVYHQGEQQMAWEEGPQQWQQQPWPQYQQQQPWPHHHHHLQQQQQQQRWMQGQDQPLVPHQRRRRATVQNISLEGWSTQGMGYLSVQQVRSSNLGIAGGQGARQLQHQTSRQGAYQLPVLVNLSGDLTSSNHNHQPLGGLAMRPGVPQPQQQQQQRHQYTGRGGNHQLPFGSSGGGAAGGPQPGQLSPRGFDWGPTAMSVHPVPEGSAALPAFPAFKPRSLTGGPCISSSTYTPQYNTPTFKQPTDFPGPLIVRRAGVGSNGGAWTRSVPGAMPALGTTGSTHAGDMIGTGSLPGLVNPMSSAAVYGSAAGTHRGAAAGVYGPAPGGAVPAAGRRWRRTVEF